VVEVSSNVGFGVYAAKDFQEGDFIVRYGGKLTATGKLSESFTESEDNVKDKSYNMACGVEGIGLDGKKFRNLGGFINHSTSPNAGNLEYVFVKR